MASRNRMLARLVRLTLAGCAAAPLASATDLPVPCAAGACGPTGPSSWVTAGSASFVQAGPSLTVTQASNSATLNWKSFNIGSDGRVVFQQPSATSIALNRIFQSDPSKIFGSLSANGQVYLLNRNGFVFGPTAQVDTHGLVASTLDLSPAALQNGIAQAANSGFPAFQQYVDASGTPLPSGSITLQQGAKINADAGQVLLFAPTIANEGTISTPDGQTILGAGQRIYLLASTDSNVRGLLIEVGDGGTITNGNAADASMTAPESLAGQILAPRGNVTLAALAINQLGRISATTSVRSNGTVVLQARDDTKPLLAVTGQLQVNEGGTLTLGAHSVTSVDLDTDPATAVDATAQPKSVIDLSGKDVEILDGATVRATSGTVTITARTDLSEAENPGAVSGGLFGLDTLAAAPDSSRLYIAPGATVDVSGATTTLPVSDNSLAIQLRGTELANSPLQRSSALRGQTLYIDVRQHGVLADGTPWFGTPLGDVTGYLSTIERSVAERNLKGGTISLVTQGSLLMSQSASLNVAGGYINWTPGYVKTTQLVASNGKSYDIASADPSLTYIGTTDSLTNTNGHWGVTGQFPAPGRTLQGTYEAGYVEGRDAGSVALVAPQIVGTPQLNAQVVVGQFQRLTSQPNYSPAAPPTYDTRPLAGNLTIGNAGATPLASGTMDYVADSVQFAAGPSLGDLRNPDGTVFDPRTDALPVGLSTVYLPPAWLESSGVRSLSVFANGLTLLSAGTTLDLGVGGALRIKSGQIAIDGTVTAPAGSVGLTAQSTVVAQTGSATAVGLNIGPSAVLSVDGVWTNDPQALVSGSTLGPAFVNGGSISATALDGALQVASGARLDASGGAELTKSGAVISGTGGNITLIARNALTIAGASASLDGTYQSFGLARGGNLSIEVPYACVAAGPCQNPSSVNVDPALFGGGGFSSYSLTTTRGGLSVASGVNLTLQETNWALAPAASQAPSADSLAGLVSPVVLPVASRVPVGLSLTSNNTSPVSSDYADLVFPAGASITADPGATLQFGSNSRILFGGSVVAPGGNVSLNLSSSLFLSATSLPRDQAIWFEPTGSIDTDGVAVLQQRTDGLQLGSVLPGGQVTLSASRGYIELMPGSSISANGTGAQIDMLNAQGDYVRTPVASSGGGITLWTTEGLLTDGSLSARGGSSAVLGGTLTVAIDSRRNGDPNGILPTTSREIEVTATNSPTVVGVGSEFPDSLNGTAQISAATIATGGFDAVTFRALDTLRPGNIQVGPAVSSFGAIAIDAGVNLNLRANLTLDASQIATPQAGSVSLSAPYVAIGSSDSASQSVVAATGGPGNIAISADLIDVIGQAAFTGASQVALTGSDGVRFRGVLSQLGTYNAGLRTAGATTITTPELYASTLTSGSLTVTGGALTILPTGSAGSPDPILSAGATLTLSAPSIDVESLVAVPNGSLALNAQQVEVGATGRLSVAGEDPTLFGQTQGGLSWVYALPNGATAVLSDNAGAFPTKDITLNAGSIHVAKGGVIDISGGSDLLAYEWISGPGGTNDVLASTTSFAIVPGLAVSYAPYDVGIWQGSTLKAGDSVYLAGGPGLAAGYYTLLPARYALLPGAMLVTPVSGYQDIAPGVSYSVAGGGTIIAGYRTNGGLDVGSSRTSGFEIMGASTFGPLAQYTVTSANAFLAGGAGGASVAQRRPADAGAVTLNVQTALAIEGTLDASPGAGGSGALVDVAATELRVAPAGAAPDPGVVTVTDTDLEALAASSLLLGGTRDANGLHITARSGDVTIDAGVALTAPELLLVATNAIAVQGGASLSASAGAAGGANRVLTSGAALLGLSSATSGTVTGPVSATAASTVDVEPGAVLTAPGELTVLARGAPVFAPTLNIGGATATLVADRWTLSAGAAGAPGVLSASALSADQPASLSIEGRTSIGFAGNVMLNASTLKLTTAQLADSGTDSVTLQAASAVLGGEQATTSATSGGSALTVSASSIVLAGGNVGTAGFGTVTLNATGGTSVGGSGSLTVGGSLTIGGSVYAGASAANFALTAQAISVEPIAVVAASAAPPPTGLGTTLTLAGQSIGIDAPLVFPAGGINAFASGDVNVGPSGQLNVAAPVVALGGQTFAMPGGSVELSSTGGSVLIGSGAAIIADGSSGGDGGAIGLQAPAGAVQVAGQLSAQGGAGGELYVEANDVGFAALLPAASAGGFGRDIAIHQIGPGDLVVPATASLASDSLTLVADGGAISIAGSLASPVADGRIVLAAQNGVDVSGRLAAGNAPAPLSPLAPGGTVVLETTNGAITLASGGSIDVSGGSSDATGTLWIRAPRTTVIGAIGGSGAISVQGAVAGAAQITVEGYQTYASSATIDASAVNADPSNPWYADAANFVTATLGQAGRLGFASTAPVTIAPGIDVFATGNLALASDWNVADWHFQGVAPVITLRAGGNLTLNASLSDGFSDLQPGPTGFMLPTTPGPSASYRLVAGSQLGSADPMSTVIGAAANFSIAPGTPGAGVYPGDLRMVRTGTGSIDIAASQDIAFGNQASVVYTAGVQGFGNPVNDPAFLGGLNGLPYPQQGGDIRMTAGRDVIGAPSTQYFTDWLWRSGAPSSAQFPEPTAWTIAFDYFEQGVAALAGGSVSVRAGRDIVNLNASIPTVGHQVGGTPNGPNDVSVTGGGELLVEAGRDILAGTFMVGQGSATLLADDRIGATNPGNRNSVAPAFALGDATLDVTARGGTTVESVVNPTLIPQSRLLGVEFTTAFSTYADATRVNLLSVGGDTVVGNTAGPGGPLGAQHPDVFYVNDFSGLAAPPTLSAIAAEGNVQIAGSMMLWPSSRGNLTLLASQNVLFEDRRGNGVNLVMSDADPTSLPSVASPTDSFIYAGAVLVDPQTTDPLAHGPVPLHGADGGQAEDPNPVRIAADTGSIIFSPTGLSILSLPKSFDISAGQDIDQLGLRAQNVSATDVSSIVAGRDITYALVRSNTGQVVQNPRDITIAGPGDVELIAGRNINLETSQGITTDGNVTNPALPRAGATVTLAAGEQGGAPDFNGFITKYLADESTYTPLLIAYMQPRTGSSTPLDASTALADFRNLSRLQQRPLLETILFDELRAGGRAAAAAGATHGDFTRAFDALTAFYPGSNPNLSAGETNPYQGDIDLYFSRVYTLDGGSVQYLAPGGSVNVGLATPPVAFGLSKGASQLGTVVQSTGDVNVLVYQDLLVNESRVFAADGGNILVWATDGNIDAGRGAKTAISAPPPIVTINSQGFPTVQFPPVFAGSGIQTIATTPGTSPGDVDLFAPRGVVNAGEAGIVAGNLTVAATAVLGTNNITVSGTSVGVPVANIGAGASLAGASNSAAGASNVASTVASEGGREQQSQSPLAESALNWLDVFVIGLGEDTCRPDDLDCLKRQKRN